MSKTTGVLISGPKSRTKGIMESPPYIPFKKNAKIKITDQLVPNTTKYGKSPRLSKYEEHIVIMYVL